MLKLDEGNIRFSGKLAEIIGINESIMLSYIHEIYQAGSEEGLEYDGYKWVKLPMSDLIRGLRFWSGSTIKRIIASLEEKKVLISIVKNDDLFDRTKSYRIDHDLLDKLVSGE